MIKNEISVREIVENFYELPLSNFDGKYTKTSLFLLSCLDINLYKPIVKKFLINAFIEDMQYKNSFKRPIFCLFKVSNFKDNDWKTIYKICKSKEEFITDYDCGIIKNTEGTLENLVMVVFECPKVFQEDYYNFRRGKYSKFSEELKLKLPETILNDSGTKVTSLVYNVVNKTEYMKNKVKEMFGLSEEEIQDQEEYWDIPRRERECYRYKKELND